MRESLDQMLFVWAAYGVGGIASLGLLVWSWLSMRAAEARRDESRKK